MGRGIKRRKETSTNSDRKRSNSQPSVTPIGTESRSPVSKMISPRSGLSHDLNKMKLQTALDGSSSSRRRVNSTRAEQESNENLKKSTSLLEDFNNLPAGQMMCVGEGNTGQLGLGEDMVSRKKPYPIKELADKKIKVIAAGGMHSACITEDHKIFTFGCNDEGALGRTCADDEEEFIPMEVKMPENTDENNSGKPVNITAGDSHCAVLNSNGKVYVWGNFRDGSGVLGLVNHKSKEISPIQLKLDEFIIKISSGTDHLVLLSKKGVCFTFGSGGVGQLGRGGRYFSDRGGRRGTSFVLEPAPVRFKLHRDTKRTRLRSNSGEDQNRRETIQGPIPSGSSQIPRANTKVTDVFAAGLSTFIVCNDQVYSFGLNNYKQLGLSNKENKFVPTFSNTYSQHTWLKIVGGEHHCCALTKDFQLYSIGRGDDGRLGCLKKDNQCFEETGDLVSVNFDLTDDDKIVFVSSSSSVGYAISQKGNGYAWGFGENLQLTTGEDDDENIPIELQGGRLEGRTIYSASTGGQHGLFLISPEEEKNC